MEMHKTVPRRGGKGGGHNNVKRNNAQSRYHKKIIMQLKVKHKKLIEIWEPILKHNWMIFLTSQSQPKHPQFRRE